MNELISKAKVLIEALPYIRRFYGTTMVIKYGGSAMIEDELRESVIQDVVLLKFVGMNPVLVHGGGPMISRTMEKLGKKSRFVNGLRVTDGETMEIVEMVLAGVINKQIVSLINQHGAKAVGICGKDASFILAKKHMPKPDLDIGFVGEVVRINPGIIDTLISGGFIPVIAPIGVDEGGQTYNINADTVAGEIAAALKAEKLILLTDVRGILADREDENSLIPTIHEDEVERLKAEGVIAGGMIPKVKACLIALKGGVSKTHIIDGRIPHSILLEIFTESGIGTEIVG
ncbi:acetylglutamate kinase [Candidatus Poribacteria bacterium]|nr:acetylglutamate kinase [Candidatus Poribacteria bacterium]